MTTNLQSHPTAAELDALRAGLYDDEPAVQAALTAHLAACDTCRVRAALWHSAKDALTLESPTLQNRLRARRAAALAGEGSSEPRQSRWGMPMALAAGIAALGLAIGVALYAPNGNDTVQVADAPGEVPDLYTDIDFYLWLLRKQNDESGPSG